MIHAWYLGTEFQLFIVGCVVIVLGHSYRRVALCLIAAFITISVTIRLVLANEHRFHESVLWNMAHPRTDGHNVANDLTYKLYAHASPYFIGILLGYLLRDDTVVKWAKQGRGYAVVGAAVPVGITIIAVLVYGLWPL